MLNYLIKRLLLFVPTLVVASMVAFGLSKLAEGDQVLDYLIVDPFGEIETPTDLINAERTYRRAAADVGLDKPAFYFSLTSQSYPDTLHKIILVDRKNTIEKLIGQYGNWLEIEAYYNSIGSMEMKMLSLPDSITISAITIPLRDLYVEYKTETIQNRINEIEKAMSVDSILQAAIGGKFSLLKGNFEKMINQASRQDLFIPAFQWHGFDNQYHNWASGFIKGDFGRSIFERRPVVDKLAPAIFWTMVLNLSAIILAFAISIPLGVNTAVKSGSRLDKATSLGLFMLYSLPAFWIGTMLLIFFTTKEYGLDIFPGVGLGEIPAAAPWWKKIGLAAPHLLLPVSCVAYPALAFITRQVRGGMIEVLQQEYIKTARANGLSEKVVIWKHAFRNALSPIITLLASVFPAAIAGSVTIEVIFNIPGMGWLTFNAISQRDWPVVFAVLMIGSVLTIVGILVADILYAISNPRVRLEGAEKP